MQKDTQPGQQIHSSALPVSETGSKTEPFKNGVGFGLSLFLYLSDKICPTGVPICAELYPQLEVQTSCKVT